MYIVRSDKGILVARISDAAGKSLIMDSLGHFEERSSNSKSYVLDDDMTYNPVMNHYSDFYTKIYLWKGYYIYQE